MSKRHDSLIDDVLSGLGAPDTLPRETETQGRHENRFLRRSSALAERTSGTLVEKTLRWVEPRRCRMWVRHNRRYDLLDETNCADLIEGIKAQGGQEFPAIVREIPDDPQHDYEVICGARRHWAISWLNANNYPNFRFLIEVRALTDEEAFRLADIENRDRRDISDYERAIDYADACRFYYDGHQGRMAERLEVSNAWLSRYLDLARLPREIVAAYGDIADLREFHARRMKPVLADEAKRMRLLARAADMAQRQAALKAEGAARIPGAKVLATLLAAEPAKAPAKPARREYRAEAGQVVLTAEAKPRGLSVTLSPGATRADLVHAFERLLDDHAPEGVLPIGKNRQR